MKAFAALPILVALLANTPSSLAGVIGDSFSIATGTVLSAGAYLPWKLSGVHRRCNKQEFQFREACAQQPGCSWSEDKGCRAVGLFGIRKYMKDMNAYCGMMDERLCEQSDACSWSFFGKTCKARYLNAFRETSTDRKLTPTQVQTLELERKERARAELKKELAKKEKEAKKEAEKAEKELAKAKKEAEKIAQPSAAPAKDAQEQAVQATPVTVQATAAPIQAV